MSRFTYEAPERLQFREGGGVLAVFGVPFFLAGIFMLLTAGGALPMGGDGDLGGWGRPLLGLMGLVFTGVGGGLVFGRAWATLDVAERAATRSWGLLVPFKAQARPLHEFSRVTIGFDAGDSDSSDTFPVGLKAHRGPDFVLCKPTEYAEARACAAEAAKHLAFALEDVSGGHAVTLDPTDADRPLQQRASRSARPAPAARPAAMHSQVHHETTGVRIVIPHPSVNALSLAFVFVPIAMFFVFGPPLSDFFEQTGTPRLIGLAFLGMLVFLFGVLPALTIVNGIVRARRGYVEVLASREGLTVRERGAWRVRTQSSLDAADILDVDYGTRATGVVSARHAVEQQLMESGHEPASLSPRMERLMNTATRWTKGRGVVVKSRAGLTTFGQDLDDDEIRYLADVVRQALLRRP